VSDKITTFILAPPFEHHGANVVWPVNKRIITINQNINNEEDRIREITGIILFSVLFAIPVTDNIIPAAVSIKVI
jgi:hypothetical protein